MLRPDPRGGKRSLGQRHFDVQLIGGMVLHDGSIAEMKTGNEGKTLTATLPIALNALAARDEDGRPAKGKGIHLVTVNDYLARRDANWMKPIYDVLGITVGVIQSQQNDIDKQEAYSRDVVYGTNSSSASTTSATTSPSRRSKRCSAGTATRSSTRSTTSSSTRPGRR